MKYLVLVLVGSIFTIVANAQNDSININYQPTGIIIIYDDYTQLKHFLLSEKNNPESFLVNIKPHWNSKLYQEEFKQWYTISRKKELAPAILIDSRSLIQIMPNDFGVKDLMWISPAKRYSYRDSENYKKLPFGEQVATDIIYNVAGDLIGKKKYHYRYSAAENNKAYSTPSFLKF